MFCHVAITFELGSPIFSNLHKLQQFADTYPCSVYIRYSPRSCMRYESHVIGITPKLHKGSYSISSFYSEEFSIFSYMAPYANHMPYPINRSATA